MKAYIECIEDMLMDHSTMRYAKLIVTIPEKEGGDYQKYHLGECEILQGEEGKQGTLQGLCQEEAKTKEGVCQDC